MTLLVRSRAFPCPLPYQIYCSFATPCELLPINLRSPRTVFDRILEVKSPEYQQSCPRPLEPDTLTEIVVEDTRNSLAQIINQLLEEERIPKSSIVIINATNGSQKADNYLGVQVVSAAKFRGLESPVVVVWAGNGSDETSLLCAYTRATSRCIVIYSAVEILKGNYKTFGQILVESDKIGNIQKEASLGLTSVIFSEQNFNLIAVANKTISLHWCSEWNGWIIYPDQNKQVAQLMWTHHLIVTTGYPVYMWNESDRGNLKYFAPANDLQRESVIYCNLNYCESCDCLTPFTSKSYTEIGDCVACSLDNYVDKNEFYIQSHFDQILSLGTQALDSDKKSLSIFLIALGRWNTITDKQRQELESYFRFSRGTVGYNVAHLLILIDLLKIQAQKNANIELDELATKYHDRCPDLKRLFWV